MRDGIDSLDGEEGCEHNGVNFVEIYKIFLAKVVFLCGMILFDVVKPPFMNLLGRELIIFHKLLRPDRESSFREHHRRNTYVQDLLAIFSAHVIE